MAEQVIKRDKVTREREVSAERVTEQTATGSRTGWRIVTAQYEAHAVVYLSEDEINYVIGKAFKNRNGKAKRGAIRVQLIGMREVPETRKTKEPFANWSK